MFEIIRARLSDLHTLAHIERVAAQMFPPDRLPDTNATVPLEWLQTGLQQNLLWIAKCHSKVVAFALAAQHPFHLHLVEISVHSDFARQGIGRALVERMKQETVHRGLRGLTLTTFADIAWNGPWYRRLQFKTLTPANMPEHLKQAIEEEREAGMQHRIGMVWQTPDTVSSPSGSSWN